MRRLVHHWSLLDVIDTETLRFLYMCPIECGWIVEDTMRRGGRVSLINATLDGTGSKPKQSPGSIKWHSEGLAMDQFNA